MFKGTLFMVTVLTLILAAVAISCAPAAVLQKPAATTPPTATPAPAVTPVTPPATPPAAPAAPAVIKTSFEAATYTNDANGYSFLYPKTWIPGNVVNDQVVNLVAAAASGADSVSSSLLPESADFGQAMKAAYDADPGLKQYSVKVNIKSSKAITLANGKTQASEAIVTATIMGIYDLWGYGIGVNKGGKTIMVTGWTLGGEAKQNQIMEIVKTFTVK
jgi:hypothetical protein